MKIYTLTLNPAYDLHAAAGELQVGKENFACVTSCDAGGKGVNISRALLNGGVENTAIVIIGDENGGEFKKQLQSEGVNCVFLEKSGRIRENLTVHAADGKETRISFSGFSVTEQIFDELRERMSIESGDIVAFSGSIPNGVSVESVKRFLLALKEKGVLLALDCRSLSIADIIELQPWLVKPNEEEFSKYYGEQVNGFDDCVAQATELSLSGVENVMVSLGEKGALLAADGLYIATPPKVKAVSTIGAGDSAIAGFISAFVKDVGSANCLKTAVAYGTAACLTAGTKPPELSDIEEICKGVQVRSY